MLTFYSRHGIGNVCFLGVRSDCRLTGETLPAEAYADYMRRLFDAWLRKNDPGLRVREFGNWMLLAVGLPGNLCSSAGSCVGNTFSVEPDGRVFSCDKFAPDERFGYGPVGDLDFDALPGGARCRALRGWDLDLPGRCGGCEHRTRCAGGCGHDRYLEQAAGRAGDRCHLRELIAHVHGRIENHPMARKLMATARVRDIYA